MSTIGTTLFSKIEINGQEVDIATLDANDGIYALPAGYTTANVKFTMIDNTSIPRGVFEENSYITAMTLPDAMTYIASYSFHGVNNINISDKNAILAINPYAFDAEPTPSPTTDPDIYFDDPEITLDYYLNSSKLNGNRKTQSLRGGNTDDKDYITWSTSDTTIATVQGNGYVIAHRNGTVNVIVNYAAHDKYNSKTVQYQLTITNYKLYSTGGWYNNGDPAGSIEVVQGGSSSYILTFSGTPSDSWTFTDPMVSGISVDTSTGTITINESQLNTTGTFINITANRPTDTNYYEGSAQTVIIITTPIDPDIYFMNPTLTIDYQMEPNKLNGTDVTQALSGSNASSSAWIMWSTDNSSIATVNHGGYVIAQGNGTVNIIAEYTAHDNYNSKTVQYQLTITNYNAKQNPTGGWYENSSQVWNLDLVEGNTSDKTLTFSATPNDSWTFYDPGMPGISVNTTTGEITITGASVQSTESSISASRMEDANYYSGNLSLNIKVFPAGTDLNFHFDQISVNLDNQGMTTITPVLTNYTAIDTTLYPIQYVSGDTNVATVDAYGMISFAGGGTTTITATLSDGNETHTATITVYCTVNKQHPYASFEYNGTTYSGGTLPVVAPFTGTIQLTNMTPSNGWVITDPMIQGITVLQNVIEVQDLSQGYYNINASRAEDSNYYYGMSSLALRVLPAGSNLNFYYEQELVNLDNQGMTRITPILINNTGFEAMANYQSADTTIATVDFYGNISFAGAGTTTVTASITNGVDTYTTSITVNCQIFA